MNGNAILALTTASVVAFLVGAGAVWLYGQAEAYDAAPDRNGLKQQMMRRKSEALQALMEEVLAGRLDRLEGRVAQLERYSATIDGFLATDIYDAQGAAWTEALRALRTAALEDDWQAARDATLALERSCLDCHRLLHAREQ